MLNNARKCRSVEHAKGEKNNMHCKVSDEPFVVANETNPLLFSGKNRLGSSLSSASGEGGECKELLGDVPRPYTSRLRGRMILLFVAFLYGTLDVSLKMLYELPGPPSASVLSTLRGWLAAAAFLPLIPKMKAEIAAFGSHAETLADDETGIIPLQTAAFELAIWNFGAQSLLNVGLLFTYAPRASFLTQTSVVITPLLSFVAGQKVSGSVVLGCAVALAGLILLSDRGDSSERLSASDESMFSLSGGDLLVLAGALSWSMYVFRVSKIGERYPEISLQGVKSILLACLYSSWFVSSMIVCFFGGGWNMVADLWRGYGEFKAWALLFFSAIGPGALADVLQQIGQKEVSASEANIILCCEPVFTAILARFLLGEVTSPSEILGGALILVAAILASR